MGEITENFDNLRIPIAENLRQKGATPYYGANGIQGYIDGFTHNGEFVLIAEDGANDLKNYPVQYVNGKVWVNNHAHIISGKTGLINNLFLTYRIKSMDISSFLVGGSRAKLNASTMKEIDIYFPKLEEQTAIGNFFKQLDETIALHQRQIEKYQKLKIGFSQSIFCSKISLNQEKNTNAWEQRKLGEIGTTFGGLTGKSKDDFGHGKAKYVTYLNVYSNCLTSDKALDLIEIDNTQNQVQKGDVFFTTSSETPDEVGLSSVWTYDIPNVYLNSFCFGYRPSENIDLNYLAYMLRSKNVRNQIVLLAQGISRYNISKKSVMEINVYLPKLEEQAAIGNFFKQLDETIALHQRKIEKYQFIKQLYLEKMFIK